MDLKSVLSSITTSFKPKPDKAEIHLAVKISTTSVTATVWSVENGKVVIGKVGFSPVKESAGWDDFLKSVDAAVSQTLKDNDSDAQKVIFAIPNDWVTDGKIHQDHLKSLRHLCKELDLSAVGYVVLTEALENFFKEVEGAPLTGILVGIDGDRTSLAMYRAGKNLGTFPVGGTAGEEDFPAAIEKTLKRFVGSEVFPSRFILYNGKSDLGPLAEKLTAYPWTKNLPFLHFPKVEIIGAEFVVKAVAVAAGMQMGGVFDADPFPNEKQEFAPKLFPEDKKVARPHHGDSKAIEEADIKIDKKEEDLAKPPETAEESDTSLSGGAEETVSVTETEDAVERIDEDGDPIELEEVSAEDAGFVVGDPSGDLAFHLPPAPQEAPEISRDQNQASSFAEMPSPPGPVGKASPAQFIKSSFGRLLALIPRKPTLPSIALVTGLFHRQKEEGAFHSAPKSKRNFIPLILVGLGVLVAISVIVYFVPKANLIVSLETKPFEHRLEVVVAAEKEASASAKSIPGTFIETSEVGTKKGVSTGSKLVGESAKGSVTIFSVSNARAFATGTVIASPDGLKFTLDRDANVASGDAVTPSTVTVPVTATDIGDKYNLTSGTKFTIGTLPSSQYLAKSEASFTGGNSHQATVVTKADQDRLLAALTTELGDKAKANLTDQVPEGTTLLPNAVTGEVVKKTFSKAVGDEADTFSVDLTVSFKGVVFSKKEMADLFLQTFPGDLPENYHLEADPEISVSGTTIDKTSNNPVLQTQITGKLLPQIDVDELKKKLSGKGTGGVSKELSTIPGFVSVQKTTAPKILNFVTDLALPWRTQNLTIEIVAQ